MCTLRVRAEHGATFFPLTFSLENIRFRMHLKFCLDKHFLAFIFHLPCSISHFCFSFFQKLRKLCHKSEEFEIMLAIKILSSREISKIANKYIIYIKRIGSIRCKFLIDFTMKRSLDEGFSMYQTFASQRIGLWNFEYVLNFVYKYNST